MFNHLMLNKHRAFVPQGLFFFFFKQITNFFNNGSWIKLACLPLYNHLKAFCTYLSHYKEHSSSFICSRIFRVSRKKDLLYNRSSLSLLLKFISNFFFFF